MNVVKVTTSGQITLPKELRKRFKTDLFFCELNSGGILFLPLEVKSKSHKKYKYTMEDLKKWKFKGKNPKESYAERIDEIIYTI